MACSLGGIPNGQVLKECINEQLTSLIVFDNDVSFTNYVDAENSETWRALIQEGTLASDIQAYISLDVYNVTSTQPSPNKETDGAGNETTTRFAAGSAIFNLRTNPCDFKQILQTMQGGSYKFALGLGENKVMLVENNKTGVLKGFSGQGTSHPYFPAKDAKIEEFKIEINWSDVNEWRNYRIIELPISLKELAEFTPLGLDMQVKTQLASSDMDVKVATRCAASISDLETDTLTGEVTKFYAGLDTPTASPAAGTSAGDYTVTVQKSAVPEDLEQGDFIEYQVVKKTGSVYEKVSNVVRAQLAPA